MKMLFTDRMRQRPESNYRSEYGGDSERRMIGYDRDYQTENRRRRDSRGRYMEGGGAAYNGGYEHDMPHMGGYGGTEARRRDSRGRYMMGGDPRMMDDDYDEEDMRSQTWYPPHMMGGSGSRYGFGDVYAHIQAPNAMNRPGMMGMQGMDMSAPVDEKTAREWVQRMSSGQKYSPEQAEQLRAAHCPSCEKWEWYVALNAAYSDHCESAKTMGLDKNEFYAMMAKDFLKDKDAGPHKLRKYMEIIPR
jgi:hypothetical protein